MADKQQAIVAAYNLFNDDDISAAWLLQTVADHCKCSDVSEVIDALVAGGILEEIK